MDKQIRYAKRVVFSTDDSAVPVQIVWPDPLSAEEIQDLEEFLQLWMRGLKRRLAHVPAPPITEPAPNEA